MNTTTNSQPAQLLRRVLDDPTPGIPGLVDDLLTVCREHDLQLDWHADRLRVRSQGGYWEELSGEPIGKSVFRAILARLAVLCNERTPDSVSAYGGEGHLSTGNDPAATFRVRFSNTPDEQRLELIAEPLVKEVTQIAGDSVR